MAGSTLHRPRLAMKTPNTPKVAAGEEELTRQQSMEEAQAMAFSRLRFRLWGLPHSYICGGRRMERGLEGGTCIWSLLLILLILELSNWMKSRKRPKGLGPVDPFNTLTRPRRSSGTGQRRLQKRSGPAAERLYLAQVGCGPQFPPVSGLVTSRSLRLRVRGLIRGLEEDEYED